MRLMTKQEFLLKLRKSLHGLPEEEIEERLLFFSEIIDDRIEEGMTEEEAVLKISADDEIAVIKEQLKPKRSFKTLEMILLILGSPIWLSLLIALAVVIFSLFVALWSVFALFASGAFGGIISGTVFIASGEALSGIAAVSAGMILAGLSILTFYGCRYSTRGIFILTKKCFKRKEQA
jgi:uncharacterized membrane protein